VVALSLSKLCIEESHRDYRELNRHEKPQEVEEDLEDGPFLGLEEPPSARRKNEGVPSCNCKGADKEVFMGR